MKAQLWKISVCEGVVDMIHGGGSQILEVFIPDLNIAINMAYGSMHYFETKDDRYKVKNDASPQKPAELIDEFKLPDDVAYAVMRQIKCKEEFENKYKPEIEKLFKTFEKHKSKKS